MTIETPGTVFQAAWTDLAEDAESRLPQHGAALTDSAALGGAELVPEHVPALGTFAEQFDIIGMRSGGMGRIYICVPKEGPRFPWAFKSYAPELLIDAASQRAFRRECSIAIELSFLPGILPVFDVIYHENRPFLMMQAVMPDADGVVSLRDIVNRGPVPPTTTGFYAYQIAFAMMAAAESLPGVVHGDLKPENVLMVHGMPHIADFGLAVTMQEFVPGDVLLAAPEYRAPEAGPDTPVAVAWDVYSFGVMLAELLTGEILAPGDDGPPRCPIVTEGPAGPDAEPPYTGDMRAWAGLMALARRCGDTDPAERPGDFSQVRAELDRIAPGGWPVPDSAQVGARMLRFLPLLAALTRSTKVLALLRIGDNQAALDMVDRMPPDTRDWKLWLCRGTALSLLDRDEEALDSFQQAGFAIGIPRSKEDEQAWWEVDRERAASLKRLGRFEEAIVVLEHLIATGDEDRRLQAMGNLAALYVTTQRYAEAQALLADVITRDHKSEKPLINLAALYQAVGDYPAAADALSRAVARRPGSLLARQRLGEVLLLSLGQVEAAADALEGALGVGGVAPRLLTARLACAVLMTDVPGSVRVIDLTQRHHGKEEVAAVWTMANVWAATVARRFFQPIESLEATFPEELRELVMEEADALARKGPPPSGEPPQRGEAPASAGRTADYDPSGDAAGDDPSGDTADGDPAEEDGFFVHRAGAGTFGYDMYLPFSSPDFPRTVAARHHTAASFLAHQAGLALAGTPLLLVRCGSCGAELVTNRPEGETFTCQACQNEATVIPAEDADLAGIRTELESLVYSEGVRSLGGLAVIIAVQPQVPLRPGGEELFAEIVRRHGMERLPADHFGLLQVFAKGLEAGLFKLGLPMMGARWHYPAERKGVSSISPPEVQAFAGEAKASLLVLAQDGPGLPAPPPGGTAPIASMSQTYDPGSGSAYDLIMDGQPERAEEVLRAGPAGPENAGGWVLLTMGARLRGDPMGTGRLARAAIAADPDRADAWFFLAEALLAGKQPDEALAAARRACHLAPDNPLFLELLAGCWHAMGDSDRAQAAARRARELGAVPVPRARGAMGETDDAWAFVDTLLGAIGGHQEARAAFAAAIADLDDGDEANGPLASALRRMLAGERPEDLIADSGPAAPVVASIVAAMSPRPQQEPEGSTEEAADRLGRLGMAYAGQGRFDEALDCLRRAAAIWEALSRPLERAMTGNNLGGVLRSAGRLDEAAAELAQSLSFYRRCGERLKEANSLVNLGFVRVEQDQPEAALECHQAALKIYEDAADEEKIASALSALGVDYRRLEQYEEARTCYERALATYEKEPPDSRLGTVLFNLCLLDLHLENWQAAVTAGQKAAATFRTLDDRVHEAEALTRTAVGHAALESWPEAADCLERALGLGTGDAAGQEQMRLELRRALLAQAMGTGLDSDYDRLRSAFADDAEQFSRIVRSVAAQAMRDGDYQATAIWLLRLEELLRRCGDQLQAAMTAVDAGAALRRIGDVDQAKQHYLAALPVLRAAGETAAAAMCLHNLGMAHRRLGESEEAAAAYREALTLQEHGPIQDRISTMNSLGLVLFDLDRREEATRQLDAALDAARTAGYHYGELQTLLNLTHLALAADQPDLARQHWQSASRVPSSANEGVLRDFMTNLGRNPRLNPEP